MTEVDNDVLAAPLAPGAIPSRHWRDWNNGRDVGVSEAAEYAVADLIGGQGPDGVVARLGWYRAFFPDALAVALKRCLAERSDVSGGRGGRPPAAVSAARKVLAPYLRKRGNPQGRGDAGPDDLQNRDLLWWAVSRDLEARGYSREAIAQHIYERHYERANADQDGADYVGKRLQALRRLWRAPLNPAFHVLEGR